MKERSERAANPIMMEKSSSMDGYDPQLEQTYQGALNSDGTSIMYVTMNMGSILFASAEADPLKME